MAQLLRYAAATPEATYFDPNTDVEVYDNDEEVWNSLEATSYSLGTLLTAVEDSELLDEWVRLTEDAERYLRIHREGQVGDDLHDDPLMTRERLLALVEADYTETDDLHRADDVIDIGRNTGIDRSVIETISTRHVSGFSTATSLSAGAFDDCTPRDTFTGWALTHDSDNRIRWTTTGRFNLTLDAGDQGITLTCNLPREEDHPAYRKGRRIELPSTEDAGPDEALIIAHNWLELNELTPEDDLARVRHVGPATKDYLYLAYGVDSFESFQSFADTQSQTFEDIFGDDAPEVREEIQRCLEEKQDR